MEIRSKFVARSYRGAEGFIDAHLNDPADFWGAKTNKMFVLTQVANHDALHYGNLVAYLRLNGLEPSGGWF